MSVYLVLSTITRDNGEGKYGRIDLQQYREKINDYASDEERRRLHAAGYNGDEMVNNEIVKEKGQEWLDDLISRIEAGEV